MDELTQTQEIAAIISKRYVMENADVSSIKEEFQKIKETGVLFSKIFGENRSIRLSMLSTHMDIISDLLCLKKLQENPKDLYTIVELIEDVTKNLKEIAAMEEEKNKEVK